MTGNLRLLVQPRHKAANVPFGQGLYLATNSLTTAQMWLPDWKASGFDAAFGPTATLFVDPTDGDMALINALGNSPAFGTMSHSFLCPPGVTEVTLEIKIKLPQGAVANTINSGLFLPAYAGYVNGINLTVLPTPALATHTLVYSGLTPGLVYHPIWNFNFPAQAPTLVKSIRVIPTTGAGIFGGVFYRATLVPGTAIYDGQPEAMFSASFPTVENIHRCSSNTRYAFYTDATAVTVESFNQDATFPQYVGVGTQINSVPGGLVGTGAGLTLSNVSLAAGRKRLEIYEPPLWLPPMPGSNSWAESVYFGPCTKLYNPGELFPDGTTFLYDGDSVTAGFYGDPGKSATALSTNQGRFKFALRAAAGQSLLDIAPNPGVAATYIALLAAVSYDTYYFGLGANDALLGTFGGLAGFLAALENYLDQYLAANPSKLVVVQSPLAWAAPLDPVVAPYRTGMQAVAAARPRCRYINGFDLLPQSLLIDDFHPAQPGMDYLTVSRTAALVALGF